MKTRWFSIFAFLATTFLLFLFLINSKSVTAQGPLSGAYAYANSVVGYQIYGTKNTHTNPNTVLGTPCSQPGGDLSLGGGWVIVDMGLGEEIIDSAGADLKVYESEDNPHCNGGGASPYAVFVSNSPNGPWVSIGNGNGVSEFDISSSGLISVRYVRVEDRSSGQPDNSSPTPGADIAGFEALHMVNYSISGQVTDGSGNPLSNIPISGLGWQYNAAVTTDSNGNYVFSGLARGFYVILAPTSSLYKLSPFARIVRLPPNASNQNFTTTPIYGALTGRVTVQGSGHAIANARVSAGGKVGRTDANGNYTLINILPGMQTIRVSSDGYEAYKSEVIIQANVSTTYDIALKTIRVDGYYLPFPGGKTYICTQGNDGKVSHYGNWRYAFDFGMKDGHQVVAARDGRIVAVQENYNQQCRENTRVCRNSANYVRIRHTDGTDTLYWHLKYQSVPVNVGDTVRPGQVIGESDTTGYATGSHLDFTRHKWGEWKSIPISFVDVLSNNGVPQQGKPYTSGNYLAPTALVSSTATDTEPPQGNVRLRLTGQPTYTLQLSAADYASNVTQMRLTPIDSGLQTATWQSFSERMDWTFPEVFVQYKDAAGNVSSVFSDTLEATAYEPIQASFVVSPTVCVDEGLSLINQTTPFCEQCGWNWDFGNGISSEEAEPQFDYVGKSSFFGYETPGIYNIMLTVTNANSISTMSKQVEALPIPDSAFTLIRAEKTITVEAKAADTANWLWDFGDGTTATSRIATHTYTNTSLLDVYPIQLIVEGNNGCTNIAHQYLPAITEQKVYLPIIIKGN